MGSDLLTLDLLISVYAIDPVVAGALFLAGLVANACDDLGVGIWLTRHPQHAARSAATALVLATVSFPATILLAPYGPWHLLAATLAFRIAYAGCDVPHNALLTRLGSNPAKAIWLARGRTVGTAIASLLPAWGVSGSGTIATVPLLCGIALAALVVGSTIVPLLVSYPLHSGPPVRAISNALPLPFLTASVIGIVALDALAKALLHLPALVSPGDGMTILALLISGRTRSALVPIRIGSTRSRIWLPGGTYGAAVTIAAGLSLGASPAMLVLLGFVSGASDLAGWALLPALVDGPRGYGLYTMASKLALDAGGLALAGGLGEVPTFTPAAFASFAGIVAVAAIVAGLLVPLCLTSPAVRGFSAR